MVGYAGAAGADPIVDLVNEIARKVPGGLRSIVAGETPGIVPDAPATPSLAPARVPGYGQLQTPPEFNPGFPPPPAPPGAMQPPGAAEPDGVLQRIQQGAAAAPAAYPHSQTPATAYSGQQGGVAPAAAPAAAAPVDSDVGPLGRMLPDGVRNPIVDALSALGGIDADHGGIRAFGSGFSGAAGSRQAREDRKMALTAAADEKQYRRGREGKADARDEAQLSLAERRERREGLHDQAQMSIEERKADREERAAGLEEISTAAGILKTRAETMKLEREYSRAGLSTKEMLDVEEKVVSYGKTLMPSGQYEAPSQAQLDSIKNSMDAYRTDLMGRLGTDGADAGGAVPKNGAAAGDGTWDSPVTIPPGVDFRGAVEKLAPGTIFTGPDGKPWEKH